ncbi:MAG: SIS domain-containing protein [Desulfobacula sp.]|nr:SIS domain-containing protein [Desulfobacula sp.]
MKHSTTIKSPVQWYDALFKAIKKVECKVGEKKVPFEKTLEQTIRILTAARQRNATVYWVGNGGSAAICSHLCQDMMNKLKIRSIYHGDTSLLTCMANDFGYEQVYARPLNQMAQTDDVLIAISSSGNSENILSCIKVAQDKRMKIITLSGMNENNRLWNSFCDVSFTGLLK